MLNDTLQRRIFHLFGQMIEYPRPGLSSVVRECEALVSSCNPEAAALLRGFGAFVETTPFGRLEEVFSGAFDVDAACYPYVGYHLFGETYKRSVFMLGLKERYRAFGFTIPGNELPDHLAVIVGFLGTCDDAAESEELIQEALLPTLKKMIGKGEEDQPTNEADGTDWREVKPPAADRRRIIYRDVLQALRLVLQSLSANGQTASVMDAPAN